MPQGIKTTLDFLNIGKIINLPDGVDPQDAATVHQLATGAGTAVWGGITGSISDQTDLISGGKILPSLLPALAITDTNVVSSEAEMLALTAETGDIAVRTDETKTYILKGTDPSVLADWELLLTPTGGVVSVFGRSGAVTAQSGDYSFSQISGTAEPTQGGTGLTTYAKGDVLIATGTNTVGVVSASATDGYVFTWDAASGLPMWKAAGGGGGTGFLKQDGSTPLTGDWDAGEHFITLDGSGTAAVTSGLKLYAIPPVNPGDRSDSSQILFRGSVNTSGTVNNYDFFIGTGMVNGNRPLSIGSSSGGINIYGNGDVQFIKSGILMNSNGMFSGGNINLQSNGAKIKFYNGSNGSGGGVQITPASGVNVNSVDYYSLDINHSLTATSGAKGGSAIYIHGAINSSGTSTGNFYGILHAITETSLTGRHIAYQNNYGDVLLNVLGGKTGIGSSSVPTAKLQIAASSGSANDTPLKLTAGTNVTTPEDGSFEYDGTHLYFTIGTTRNILI